ncbi:alpha-L-fucosidase [Purpureocillium lavendulum]|uniref:alpha-L-fucosidase n=1 Tax=Purpureocillium lavendulum TaxID=1247861 RepID=A0AB34FC20_9HYPO|nr:alpha-L-fucosidase [Purpureocillium lavendulum]
MYEHHEKTYGRNFNYDDFISNFTVAAFDPKEWVNLIADAGAQYFVPTTSKNVYKRDSYNLLIVLVEHHDGFALFNFSSSISRRSSIHYGPKTDIIGKLMAAAKQYQPSLRREWYNPASAKYSWDPWQNGYVAFPGGPPKNPYSNQVVPYTGYVEIKDFITDIQLPQMRQLAYEYDTDLMWCDPGGPNNGTIFASEWLNWARDRGRQVAFNNRCGLAGDFDTPDTARGTTNSEIVARKWESCQTLDPHSWGYNYMTPDGAYHTGEWIVTSLVDIVSKNGNFLLNIGPRHDGSIPDIMQKNLRDAGQWIKAHGESIFGTRYWNTTAGTGSLRYTTTTNAFYIHYIGTPPSTINILDPVPYLPGDTVTVVGGSKNGSSVPVNWNGIGTLKLNLSSDIISADKYVWTFKIGYSAQ